MRTKELTIRNERLIHEIEEHEQSKEKIKQQQELLIQSEKMSGLGQVAAGIAHEINNPLAIITGYSEHLEKMLADESIDKSRMGYMVDKIQTTTVRISKIIRGLRTYARHGIDDPFQECSLNEIVADVLILANESLVGRCIEIRKEFADDERYIDCRAEQISQVILNLVTNAMDATEGNDERWIEVSIDSNESHHFVRIIDSGHGIPEDIASHMFDPFYTT